MDDNQFMKVLDEVLSPRLKPIIEILAAKAIERGVLVEANEERDEANEYVEQQIREGRRLREGEP